MAIPSRPYRPQALPSDNCSFLGGHTPRGSSRSTAKLWAEAIENIPPGPLEAAAATGASRLKVVAFALFPDVAPSMVSVGLFWWEFNVRASTVLGVVGAGGIGQELKNSMDLLLFPRLLTIILLILVTVTVIDHTSEWLRRKLE